MNTALKTFVFLNGETKTQTDLLMHVVLPGIQLLPPHECHGVVISGQICGRHRLSRVLVPAGKRGCNMKTVTFSIFGEEVLVRAKGKTSAL